jgi:hypothetical protein
VLTTLITQVLVLLIPNRKILPLPTLLLAMVKQNNFKLFLLKPWPLH